MKPDGKLEPQDWMTAPASRAVLAALQAEGAEVRFVGGCVRDALAGRRVKDIDLATADPPEKVMALLENAGLKAVPTGVAHGTVTAISGHHPFEVTTLRQDVETHGRHATVAFTDDWAADAARRDFTFNALSCRADGTLFDPFGGSDDLRAGRVRFVGEAGERIEEDYLRLLRFFRFHAHYGRGAPDRAGLVAAAALAPKLVRLSGERIRNEIFILLEAPDPVPVLEIMARHRIFAAVLPELGGPSILRALIGLGVEMPAPDVVLRLGAMIEGGSSAAAVADRLRASKAERIRLDGLCRSPGEVAVDMEASDLRRAIYKLGRQRVGDLLRLDWARRVAEGQAVDRALARQALDLADTWEPPRFPLKGRDALDLGVAPGETVGRILAEIETWWLAEEFRPDRAACLARLRDLAVRAGSS